MPLFGAPQQDEGEAAHPIVLNAEQKRDWLRLIRTPNIGPVTFWRLINYFGGAAAALEVLPELFRRAGSARSLRPASMAEIDAELRLAERHGASLVARGEVGYPPLLAHVEAPPPLLYIKGRAELAARPALAIVGSRNSSAIGEKFTRLLANELGTAGFVIVSGLARGIDAAAHAAGLATGTIASIAGGIGNYYPPQNRDLQQRLESDGLVISECPPEYEPRAQDFPRRNRIIAGSAHGTLVIEASLRSGSLITARLAGELGREVMAVPGHPFDPRAAGTNRLIRQGAAMITSAEDVIEAIGPVASLAPSPASSLTEQASVHLAADDIAIGGGARETVLRTLGMHPIAVDDLICATRLSAREVRIALLELELDGRLIQEGAQMVRLNTI